MPGDPTTVNNLASMRIAIFACGLTMLPSLASQPHAKTKNTKLSSNAVYAVAREDGDGPKAPPPISDAELERLAALKGKFFDATSAKKAELHSVARQMQLLMAKSTLDRPQILQLQNRINAIHTDLANSRLFFELDILDGMPAEAKERMRKQRLFAAAFGPGDDMGGPPPPGFGPPLTCAPPPGFGPPHPLGPPPFGSSPGREPGGRMGPNPGRGPGGAPPPPPQF